MRPPWLLPPLPQAAGELPPPGMQGQRRQEITCQTAEREVVPLGPETTPTNQPESGPEIATTPHNQPRPSEEEGRPRREVRRPVRYQDYECYALQPGQRGLKDWKIATRNPIYKEKELVSKDVRIATRNIETNDFIYYSFIAKRETACGL